MRKCSISIVVPAYNVEKYIGEALQSIKAQTENPDELIVIDDGSSDRTAEIAKSFNFNFPYKVISIANSGQGNARNIGVSLATSDYVYFFDSDDLLSENFINSIKDVIRHNDYPDIVLFSGESFKDSGYKGNRLVDYNRGCEGIYADRESLLDDLFLSKGLFCSPCLYVSKKVFWGNGRLVFCSNYLEDEAIFYSLLFFCESFVVIDKIFFFRRNRSESTMTMAPNEKHVHGALDCIKESLSLYRKDGLSNREKWHIKKRMTSHCICYIVLCRKSSSKISYIDILSSILVTKNVFLAIKSFAFIVGADECNLLRNIGKSMTKAAFLPRR